MEAFIHKGYDDIPYKMSVFDPKSVLSNGQIVLSFL